MDERAYWLWLAEVLGPACPEAGAVLREFGSAKALWEAAQQSDLSLCLPTGAARRLRQKTPEEFLPCLEGCAKAGIQVLCPCDSAYPQRLRALPDLPLALYVTGNAGCLNGGRYVGMVGTRRPTAYGVKAAHEISLALAKAGAVIVSGLADGLDSEGHRAAAEAGAPTVAFLGTPIDRTYPAANRALRRRIETELVGAVVSEYPPEARMEHRAGFLQRNRLIAGLSHALCVAEARTHSGTANTVGHALRYGRPVFAVPGSIFSPVSDGANELLAAGKASVLRSAADVLSELWPELLPQAAPQNTAPPAVQSFSENARRALAVLGPQAKSVTEICEQSGLAAGAALAALMELELAGAATAGAGRRYTAAQ